MLPWNTVIFLFFLAGLLIMLLEYLVHLGYSQITISQPFPILFNSRSKRGRQTASFKKSNAMLFKFVEVVI